MTALTADLAEVHTIMSKNIAEVLGQGEKLDSEYRFSSGGVHGLVVQHLNALQAVVRLSVRAWVS